MEQSSPDNNNTEIGGARSQVRRWWKAALIAGAVAVGVILAVLFVILLMIARNPSLRRATVEISDCGSRLKTIGAALNRYELRHGAYPEKLEDLCPEYLASRSVFRCTGDKTTAKTAPSSYEYRRPKPEAAGNTIVCVCRRHHLFENQPPLEIMLYKDGRLGWATPEATRVNRRRGAR